MIRMVAKNLRGKPHPYRAHVMMDDITGVGQERHNQPVLVVAKRRGSNQVPSYQTLMYLMMG